MSSSERYGHLNVTSVTEELLLHYVIRTLQVEVGGAKQNIHFFSYSVKCCLYSFCMKLGSFKIDHVFIKYDVIQIWSQN